MAKWPAKKVVQTKKKVAKAEISAPTCRAASHPLADLKAEIGRLFGHFPMKFPSFPTGRSLFDWEPFGAVRGSFDVSVPDIDVFETDKSFERDHR